jgi:hypothetical protein
MGYFTFSLLPTAIELSIECKFATQILRYMHVLISTDSIYILFSSIVSNLPD